MTTHTEVPVVDPDQPREFAKRPFRFSRWARDTGWRHLIAIVAVIFAVFPLLYVVSASLNPSGSLVGSNQLFATVDFSNFAALFANPEQSTVANNGFDPTSDPDGFRDAEAT